MRTARSLTLATCLGSLVLVLPACRTGPTEAGNQAPTVVDLSAFEPARWVIDPTTTRLLDHVDDEGEAYRTLRIDLAEMELAVLRDFTFLDGALECELRGGAYLGLAFRVQDDGAAEVFYFRPRPVTGWEHTIQYMARGLEDWGSWEWIRANHPGRYETGVVPIPGNKPDRDWWSDPEAYSDAWFHVRVVVSGRTAAVYVDGAAEPALVVDDLKHGERPGTIGLYAWRGEFRGLRVLPTGGTGAE